MLAPPGNHECPKPTEASFSHLGWSLSRQLTSTKRIPAKPFCRLAGIFVLENVACDSNLAQDATWKLPRPSQLLFTVTKHTTAAGMLSFVCNVEWIEKAVLLRPYHPERARSRLISEAKQGRAWLVPGWEKAVLFCQCGAIFIYRRIYGDIYRHRLYLRQIRRRVNAEFLV